MAGEVTLTLSRSVVIGGQTIGGAAETVLADTQTVYKETVPTGSTDYELDVPITVANIQVSALHSTQNVTLKTNSSSSPVQTIPLIKNAALVWSVNEPAAAKTLTTDVTKFFITNASGFDAVVTIGFGLKQAPTGSA